MPGQLIKLKQINGGLTLQSDVSSLKSTRDNLSITIPAESNANNYTRIYLTDTVNADNILNSTSTLTAANVSGNLPSTVTVTTMGTADGSLANKKYVDDKFGDVSKALLFQGIATVAIADGSTTDPVITGYDFSTVANGHVIIYQDKEFVWSQNKWNKLGDESAWLAANATITTPDGNANAFSNNNVTLTKANFQLENVTNDRQVKGLASGTTATHVVVWGADGYTVADSGKTIDASVPANANFKNYTFSGGLTATDADSSDTDSTITVQLTNTVTAKTTQALVTLAYDANGMITGSTDVTDVGAYLQFEDAYNATTNKVATVETVKDHVGAIDVKEVSIAVANVSGAAATGYIFPVTVANTDELIDSASLKVTINGIAYTGTYSSANNTLTVDLGFELENDDVITMFVATHRKYSA